MVGRMAEALHPPLPETSLSATGWSYRYSRSSFHSTVGERTAKALVRHAVDNCLNNVLLWLLVVASYVLHVVQESQAVKSMNPSINRATIEYLPMGCFMNTGANNLLSTN